MEDNLTPKQQAFVHAYQGEAKGNGVQAARIAGYNGTDETLRAIASQNLTKPVIAASLSQNTAKVAKIAEKRLVNVYEEFLKNFEFTCKLRDAAKKWVTDPENDDVFTVAPRDNEIDIVYWDFTGEIPTQRTDKLSTILERIADKYKAPSPFVKTVDLREYCLKVVDRCDTAIDKFAKMGGAYTKDAENPATEADIKQRLAEALKLSGWSDAKIAELTKRPIASLVGAQELGEAD